MRADDDPHAPPSTKPHADPLAGVEPSVEIRRDGIVEHAGHGQTHDDLRDGAFFPHLRVPRLALPHEIRRAPVENRCDAAVIGHRGRDRTRGG